MSYTHIFSLKLACILCIKFLDMKNHNIKNKKNKIYLSYNKNVRTY